MSFVERFRRNLERLWSPRPDEKAVVAVSGGVDSLVLLHLLRFGLSQPARLVVAHLDHGWRSGSEDDALWVRGLLAAWELEGRFERLESPPKNEEEARRARYGFLQSVRTREKARLIFLAHHADDQAETVLFRILRGTGLRGLAGIPEVREPGIVRPLLPFRKSELQAYADSVGIRPRLDPTNRDARFARNVVRHELLPRVEEAVAPGAVESLLRLARLAAREEAGWESLEPSLLSDVLVEPQDVAPDDEEKRFLLDRSAFLSYHPAVRARLLRRMTAALGVRLNEAGTRDAEEFSSSGASGGCLHLPGGVTLTRELDRLSLERASPTGGNDTLVISDPCSGAGEFTVGGRAMTARWSEDRSPGGAWSERFSPAELRFPLRLRAWAPGDRIRFSFGSKKLKKVFLEHRVPVRERHRWPVLVTADEAVVWIPGIARAEGTGPRGEEPAFVVAIDDVTG